MAKKGSKPASGKGKGYAYSGIPAWLVKEIYDGLKVMGVTKNTRERAFFLPIWHTNYLTSGIPKRFKNIDSFTLEKTCLYISNRISENTGLSKLIFSPVPNSHFTVMVFEVMPKSEIPFAGMTIDADGKMRAVQYLNKIKGEIQYDVTVSKELYEISAFDIANNIPIVIYSSSKLQPGKTYHVDTFMWQKVSINNERASCTMRPIHYLFNRVEAKPDYGKLKENIGKITGWDDISFQWGYDTETISLIMASVMYYEKAVPALNTIVYGQTQIGKSSIFKVMEKVFGDTIIAASKSSIKGLTGSHWESWTKGSLVSCKYTAMVDEIFRLGKQDMTNTPSSEAVNSLLNALTEILEHSDKQSSSGKGSQRMFFNKSMLGMNNLLDFKTFEKAWKADPAPFNRVSVLLLGNDIKKRMRELAKEEAIPASMFANEYEDRLLQNGIDIPTVRQLFYYLRDVVLKRVEFERKKGSPFFSYMGQTDYVHDDYHKPDKFFALVKCAAAFNWAFNSNELLRPNQKIHPTNADFMQAVRWMEMINRSFKTVMGVN